MTDEIRPTGEDLARDLRAALADVEAATPGPWNCAVRTDGTQGDAYLFAPTAPGHGGPSLLCLNPAGKAVFRSNEDARAVAAMSIAFPAAVRRALAAEAENARLRAAVGVAAGLAEEAWHRVRDSAPVAAMSYCEHVATLATLTVGRAPDAALTDGEKALLVEVRRAVREVDAEEVRNGG